MAVAFTIFGIGSLLFAAAFTYVVIRHSELKKRYENLQWRLEETQAEIPRMRVHYEQQYDNRMEKFKKKVDKENSHFMSQALSGTAAKDLVKGLNQLAEKRINRATQEFVAAISDEAEGLTRDLQFGLSEEIWDSFQQYKEKVNDSPYVIPQNARILYTKGKRTVVCIEQEPMVRTLGFSHDLSVNSIRAAVRTTANGYWYNLALPYVYFFIVFDDKQYQYGQVYFSNKPIDSAKDEIYLAPLPNVHDKGRTARPVCMGGSRGPNKSNTIAEQCDQFISLYWQRTYNKDLGAGGFRRADKRMKDLKTWQASTEEDPLFVLSVQWKKPITIKGLMEKLFDSRSHKHQLDGCDQAVRKRLDDGVKLISKRMKDEIKAVKKVDVVKKLNNQSLLEQVLCDHVEQVFEQCRKG